MFQFSLSHKAITILVPLPVSYWLFFKPAILMCPQVLVLFASTTQPCQFSGSHKVGGKPSQVGTQDHHKTHPLASLLWLMSCYIML
jgi:hypothetical protein